MAAAITASFRIDDQTVIRLPRITVLIPAQNQAATIAQTIRSLRGQTLPVASITVVCDNCTHGTAAVAAAEGALVMTTHLNTARKAGALNQALARVLPLLGDDDYLLAMDADSALCREWLEISPPHPRPRRARGRGLRGVPRGAGRRRRRADPAERVLPVRADHQPPLAGAASCPAPEACSAPGRCGGSARSAGRGIPGVPGQYYRHASITEDDEITLAMKTLGWRCLCPTGCETLTEVMPTWKDLWTAAVALAEGHPGRPVGLRVHAGDPLVLDAPGWAVRRLRDLVRVPRDHDLRALTSPGISVAWTVGILSVTAVERTVTVRRGGWRAMLPAVLILPEAYYSLWQAWLFMSAAYAAILRKEISWGHLDRGTET